MRRLGRAVLGVSLLALFALVCVQARPSAAAEPTYRVHLPFVITSSSAAPSAYTAEQTYSASLHNSARQQSALTSFVVDAKLTASAQAQAEDMARSGYFSHDSPEGKTPWDWMAEAGVTYGYAGQNIGRGYVGSGTGEGLIAALFDMMMAETPPDDYHRRSILNPDYLRIGVGVARDGAGNLYWVCNFTD